MFADENGTRTVLPVWPRTRLTAAALVALILVQAILFLIVTQRSFFFADDFNYFKLAEERSFLRYLFTPVLGVYPAPGDRLASFLLQKLFPLNFTAARLILVGCLAGTTVLLRQLVATFARSDEWWTVALVTPFALSLTFVQPVSWWSAGLPIIPALLFTVVALTAWIRSYTETNRVFWAALTVIAVAAAGAFYVKFLLIPIYLLFLRLVILPRILDLPGTIESVWKERVRWIALAVPPAAFITVFVLSGLSGRSAAEGSRPYLEYFATAWFRAFVPAAFMNARTAGSSLSIPPWTVVVVSQLLFLGIVGATWKRSSLALRGWALLVFAFAVNTAMVGTVRLPAFGVDIAYELRYYPEVALFLPLALALGLRHGAERRPTLAWERMLLGRMAIIAMVCLYTVAFLIWAPTIVDGVPGVSARSWYENLRRDVDAGAINGQGLRIVDSEPPTDVMPGWMAPDNRVSTILRLAGLDVVFNEMSEPIYLVQADGHLAEAAFRPISPLLSGTTFAPGVRIVGEAQIQAVGICLVGGARLRYGPDADITGERLAIRVFYSRKSRGSAEMVVDAADPDRPRRYLELRPFQNDAELIDLGTPRLRALKIEVPGGDRLCIERIDLGRLVPRRT